MRFILILTYEDGCCYSCFNTKIYPIDVAPTCTAEYFLNGLRKATTQVTEKNGVIRKEQLKQQALCREAQARGEPFDLQQPQMINVVCFDKYQFPLSELELLSISLYTIDEYFEKFRPKPNPPVV